MMNLTCHLTCQTMEDLPRLGWVASVSAGGNAIKVLHGVGVEHRDTWLVEGVWDGDFERGEFHRSENFFGSGVRVEGDRIYFVPSRALTDRLFYCVDGEETLVSNSLVLLLGYTGARLNPEHNYNEESRAISSGIFNYKRVFKVVHHRISGFYQVFHENLVMQGGEISFELASEVREIRSFAEYDGQLRRILGAIQANYQSPARRVKLTPLTTVSSGYDSAAVASLVKDFGVRKCFTSRKSNTPIPEWVTKTFNDDGRPVADALGLVTRDLDPRPVASPEHELYFLAGNCANTELIFQTMTRYVADKCEGAVLFTGYHGDKVWDVNLDERYFNDRMVRGDSSGVSLGEIRLKAGFIHVAVPFILARNMRDIIAISRSEEMRPWRLFNSYDRPLPRRIAEEAGVARGLFGTRKKAVARYALYPSNRVLRRGFFLHLRATRGLTPRFVYAYEAANMVAFRVKRALVYLKHRSRIGALSVPTKQVAFWEDIDLQNLMYQWAVEVLSSRVGKVLDSHRAAPSAPTPEARPRNADTAPAGR